jgi:hypothetical protein
MKLTKKGQKAALDFLRANLKQEYADLLRDDVPNVLSKQVRANWFDEIEQGDGHFELRGIYSASGNPVVTYFSVDDGEVEPHDFSTARTRYRVKPIQSFGLTIRSSSVDDGDLLSVTALEDKLFEKENVDLLVDRSVTPLLDGSILAYSARLNDDARPVIVLLMKEEVRRHG